MYLAYLGGKITQCYDLTGYTYKEWVNLDRPNFLDFKDATQYNVNPSKYLLYMDPLLSIYDNLITLGEFGIPNTTA